VKVESFQDQRCVNKIESSYTTLVTQGESSQEETSHKGLPEICVQDFKDNEGRSGLFGSTTQLNAVDFGSSSTVRVSDDSKVQEQANWVDPGDFLGSKKLEQKVNRKKNSVDSLDKSEQILCRPSSSESDIYRGSSSSSDSYPLLQAETSPVNMNFSSEFANSDEYQSFRSSVSLRKIAVDTDASKVFQV